jgi:hypothetical protein
MTFCAVRWVDSPFQWTIMPSPSGSALFHLFTQRHNVTSQRLKSPWVFLKKGVIIWNSTTEKKVTHDKIIMWKTLTLPLQEWGKRMLYVQKDGTWHPFYCFLQHSHTVIISCATQRLVKLACQILRNKENRKDKRSFYYKDCHNKN